MSTAALVRTPPSALTEVGAVVRRGLRDQRRSILTWGLSLGLMCALIAVIYPSLEDSISELMENYPPALKDAFDISDITSVEGYVHSEMFTIIMPLAMAIFAIRAALHLTLVAEDRGELDTTLTLPIARPVLSLGAFLVAAVLSAAILLVVAALTFAGGRLAGTGIDLGLTLAGTMGLWPLAVLSAGTASLLGGLLSGAGRVTAIGTGIVVSMYVADLVARLVDGVADLRYVSAFHYYGSPLTEGIDVSSFVLVAGAGVVLAAAGAALFDRRDIGH